MKKYVAETIYERLENFHDCDVVFANLMDELFSYERMNGTMTFGVDEAKDWIFQYFDDIAKLDRDDCDIDAFKEPERFMVWCIVETAYQIFWDMSIYDEYCGKYESAEVCLDDDLTLKIKSELETYL